MRISHRQTSKSKIVRQGDTLVDLISKAQANKDIILNSKEDDERGSVSEEERRNEQEQAQEFTRKLALSPHDTTLSADIVMDDRWIICMCIHVYICV